MVRQAARRGWAISTAVKEPEAPRSSATMHSFAPAHLTPILFQILQTLQIRFISHISLLNCREISQNKQFESNTTMIAVITRMQVAHRCVRSSPSSLAYILFTGREEKLPGAAQRSRTWSQCDTSNAATAAPEAASIP
jgi:hypothetical protein